MIRYVEKLLCLCAGIAALAITDSCNAQERKGMNLTKTAGPESIEIMFIPTNALDRIGAEKATYSATDLKGREQPFDFHAIVEISSNRYYVGTEHEKYLSLPGGVLGLSAGHSTLMASRTSVTLPVGTVPTLSVLWGAFESSVATNFDYELASLGIKTPREIQRALFLAGQQASKPKITSVTVANGKVVVNLKHASEDHTAVMTLNATTLILESAFLDGVQVYPTP